MSTRCRYFTSEAWRRRLNRYVAAWDLETVLRSVDDDTDVTVQIERVADELVCDPDTAAQLPIGTVLEDAAESLDFRIDAVRTAWEADHSVPTECPHPVHQDHVDFCLCHLPPEVRSDLEISHEEIRDWFRTTVREAGPDRNRFVGARFDALDLSELDLTAAENRPLGFRFVDVAGPVDFAGTHFGQDARFKGVLLGSNDDEPDSRAGGTGVEDHFTDFEGTVDFVGATFADTADFKFAAFRGPVRFNSTAFDGPAMFNYARFSDRADFMAASFDGKADFSKTRFAGDAYLNGSYESAAIFNYATFEEQVDIWSTTFRRKAEFWAATIRGDLNGRYARFRSDARFAETTFEGDVAFDHATFDESVTFDRVSAEGEIDLRQASLAGGSITIPEPDPPLFDLRDATIGDVSLEAAPSKRDDLFEYLYLLRTSFDGFDFTECGDALKPDWTLHTNDAPDRETRSVADPTTVDGLNDLEATYLKAKNGANDVGHNKAASEFFVHEMRYRRMQHGRRIVNASTVRESLSAGIRWASNALLGATSGYGERPRRVVGSSLATIGFFAVLYWLLEAPGTDAGAFGEGYLLLSVQSFISFILRDAPSRPRSPSSSSARFRVSLARSSSRCSCSRLPGRSTGDCENSRLPV